ncbi:hypothetical protein BSY16_5659 (plasmid) [Sinorhizobium sp. RAC02]|nr:hypothetical protein BSY16_5659 [Sinorhizobium sp. RAC02]
MPGAYGIVRDDRDDALMGENHMRDRRAVFENDVTGVHWPDVGMHTEELLGLRPDGVEYPVA